VSAVDQCLFVCAFSPFTLIYCSEYGPSSDGLFNNLLTLNTVVAAQLFSVSPLSTVVYFLLIGIYEKADACLLQWLIGRVIGMYMSPA
jgi:hypothetical protein